MSPPVARGWTPSAGCIGAVRARVRAWVCAHVCSGRVFGGQAYVCVRRARVCPACARAWRRRARDPAAVVRARRSARPPAGAQHRLWPRVCVRGVSERVRGPGGVGCGEQRRGSRRSQDALAPAPAPRPRGKARRQLGPAGAPLPNSWPRPGGLAERRGGGVGRRLQAAGPSPAASLPVRTAGGWPRKGGAPGRAAGGPRGAPRTKGDGDGSAVVKTTCAGGGPRSGRCLGALHLNPFAAAATAAFLRLAGRQEGLALLGSRRSAGSQPPRSGGGTGPRLAALPAALSSPKPRASSLPRPLSHLDSGWTCQLTAT